ncbi:PepSY-associated TM helix domain-containing protein [Novipirellula artificiosorum]|uniref:PepSY-associated TM helix n=1 Tax=Novipirellula artificiosorum TaxID=2528016 RepID=A0A5C6E0E9_9BACT|nr:PepSY-associated TM helix domain-containing protein [Novipirellula artificiosorum]TWU42378.1 hypothetical protein Poly41_06750 [Novipirellula artificiosorum]
MKKILFGKLFYQLNRQLHLYIGVFLCPFLVLFAISTLLMNHPSPRDPDNPKFTESTSTVPLSIPAQVSDNLTLAKQKLDEAKAITDNPVAKRAALQAGNQANSAAASELTEHALQELNLSGELFSFGPVRGGQKKITLMVPGRTTIVTLNVAKQEATLQYRDFNFIDTMSYLHRNPGPHKTKGPNWSGSKAWSWVADWTVYLTLFLTVTGIYLWLVIKAERKAGLALLGLGFASFAAITYALLAAS